MNAQQLFKADGSPTKAFFCSKCNKVSSQEWAERCCGCFSCGAEMQDGRSTCPACVEKMRENGRKSRYEKAEKVSEWSGWLYSDDLDGYNHGFYSDMDELREEIERRAEESDEEFPFEPPHYVWACKEKTFAQIGFDTVVDSFYDEAYEDFDASHLNGVEDFVKAIEVFNEANKALVAYEPDYKIAVLLS